MGNERPKTIGELFEFYYERFKPIYSHVEALTQPPVEMLFEVNAAFDHLSRFWHYKEAEEAVVLTAAAHLKRACFDAFKIFAKMLIDLTQVPPTCGGAMIARYGAGGTCTACCRSR